VSKIQSQAPIRLLSVTDVAALLQVPVKTLYQWRFRGEGPISMRIGRYLRFDPRDVEAWVESRKAR
jgi:excisionase family DNA binding protein